ncbi:MAG: TetR family transcriptional regulator [Nocardioidaceae bacterium]
MSAATEPAPASAGDSVSAEVLGRRERKKIATRRSLEDAALRLFAEKGFERTTIEDITETADVAQRTFFRYFASKEEIILGSPDLLREGLTASLEAQPDDVPLIDAVLQAIEDLDPDGAMATSEAGIARLRMRVAIANESPSVRSGLFRAFAAREQSIREYVARRTGLSATHDVYPQMVAASISGAMRVALTTWVAGDCKGDLNAIFRQSVDVLLAGISADQVHAS